MISKQVNILLLNTEIVTSQLNEIGSHELFFYN